MQGQPAEEEGSQMSKHQRLDGNSSHGQHGSGTHGHHSHHNHQHQQQHHGHERGGLGSSGHNSHHHHHSHSQHPGPPSSNASQRPSKELSTTGAHSAQVKSVSTEFISQCNNGHKLLKKAGWKEGTGLGAMEQGIVEPIRAAKMSWNRGLGFKAPIQQGKKAEWEGVDQFLTPSQCDVCDVMLVGEAEWGLHSMSPPYVAKIARGAEATWNTSLASKPSVSSEFISHCNIGHKLLKKAGWKEGTGLGAMEQGIVEPIKAAKMLLNRGLGFKAPVQQGKKAEWGGVGQILTPYQCDVCNVMLVGEAEWGLHSMSPPHVAKIARGAEATWNTSLASQPIRSMVVSAAHQQIDMLKLAFLTSRAQPCKICDDHKGLSGSDIFEHMLSKKHARNCLSYLPCGGGGGGGRRSDDQGCGGYRHDMKYKRYKSLVGLFFSKMGTAMMLCRANCQLLQTAIKRRGTPQDEISQMSEDLYSSQKQVYLAVEDYLHACQRADPDSCAVEEDIDKEGAGKEGADEESFDQEGADEEGADKEGADKEGADKEGADKEGDDKEGANKEGADKEGADKEGADKEGADKEGDDKEGANKEGDDKEGANKEGANKEGADKKGANKEGADQEHPDQDADQ
eukprot:gene24771-10413_t